jgi:hypothetical protein
MTEHSLVPCSLRNARTSRDCLNILIQFVRARFAVFIRRYMRSRSKLGRLYDIFYIVAVTRYVFERLALHRRPLAEHP